MLKLPLTQSVLFKQVVSLDSDDSGSCFKTNPAFYSNYRITNMNIPSNCIFIGDLFQDLNVLYRVVLLSINSSNFSFGEAQAYLFWFLFDQL